jgi:DMSO/TMAO reductase YedYZ molybdopterin-dependent catalytic subunit
VLRGRIFLAVMILGMSILGAAPFASAQSGGISTKFRVDGEVKNRLEIDLRKLQSFPVATENVWYYTGAGPVNTSWSGANLLDVLDAAGILTNPNVKNDILRKIIIVTGSDGYQTAIAAGEIEPEFGGTQAIIAYKNDGAPLTSDGFARLVMPADKAGGRAVANIVHIEVRDIDDLDD